MSGKPQQRASVLPLTTGGPGLWSLQADHVLQLGPPPMSTSLPLRREKNTVYRLSCHALLNIHRVSRLLQPRDWIAQVRSGALPLRGSLGPMYPNTVERLPGLELVKRNFPSIEGFCEDLLEGEVAKESMGLDQHFA